MWLTILDTGRYFNPRSPRGERQTIHDIVKQVSKISIHAPRGGSDQKGQNTPGAACISIHAPRGGSDPTAWLVVQMQFDFNPRSPRGERLFFVLFVGFFIEISIHAPRGGSDPPQPSLTRFPRVISIHAPRGGSDLIHPLFLLSRLVISIHAPRGGSDGP